SRPDRPPSHTTRQVPGQRIPASAPGQPAGPGAAVNCAGVGVGVTALGLATAWVTGLGAGFAAGLVPGRAARSGRATGGVVLVVRGARVVVLSSVVAGCAPLRTSSDALALVATATSATITHPRAAIAIPLRRRPQNRIEWFSGPNSGS